MVASKEIRRRIKSIKSTRQITKAMELVAAAKMRKAQLQALGTRTYAHLAWEMLQDLSQKTDPRLHRLLRVPEKIEKAAILLLTSNRGLIGGFNNTIINSALAYAKSVPQAEFITVGKKGRDAVRKRKLVIAAEFEKIDRTISMVDLRATSKLLIEDFINGKYDKVVLAHMDFVSTLQQKPRILELLPLTSGFPGVSDEEFAEEEPEADAKFLYEPNVDEVFEVLLPRLLEMQIYQAYLETNASEHSARMVAMKNASDAAQDLVSELTLEYNQVRQAAITKEISEIVTGQLVIQQ
jgi:F-type H+-transporting ATPase subunit gamma